MKSNTATHAEIELDILGKTVTDSIVYPFKDEIIALCDKFGKSGQSGGSAPFTATALAQAIKKLCLQEPITEITGIDEEWVSVAEYMDGKDIYQNKRESAIFRIGKDGRAYYLDAIVFKDQDGHTFTNSSPDAVFGNFLLRTDYVVSTVGSAQYIKNFPFKPKTFYIDVISKETKKDWWEHEVKDHNKVTDVFNYYDYKSE
jgi:hypothetical protein